MIPTIRDIIAKIEKNKTLLGITLYKKASFDDIIFFEKTKKIGLPNDFKTFYYFSNGFESEEDMFRIIPLNEIIENTPDRYLDRPADFHFAEYMIYSDIWTVSISDHNKNEYNIYNKAETTIKLTKSFAEFLDTFLNGGVFDGLYAWREKITKHQNKNPH